ncbi:MAG: hypothetical protein FWD94_04905 [Treponema sp.]|nr:hypothetical protein [Treponema sp.]
MIYVLAAAALILVAVFLPAFFRWRRTVRCPECKKWFALEFIAFDVQNHAVGQSSSSFGGGVAGGIFGYVSALIFGHASRTNADPFLREWGTARFVCKKCGCNVELDTRRDKK